MQANSLRNKFLVCAHIAADYIWSSSADVEFNKFHWSVFAHSLLPPHQLSWGDHGRPRAEATKSLPWHFPREAQDFQRKEGLHFFYLQNSMFVASFPLQCYVLAAWDFQLRDVTSGNVLVRCCRFCVSRKGGTGGSGWLHWKRENSMAVSGLCSR